MQYRYILLDLDGTLTDSQEGILRSIQYALQKCGRPVPAWEELYCCIGPPLAYSFSNFYGMEEPEISCAVRYYRERYTECGWKENRVYDGIPALLEALRNAGCRLAVATTKPQFYADQIVQHFGLEHYLDAVCGTSMERADESKASVIQNAMQLLGVTPEEHSSVILIGDTRFDGIGAEKCGIAFAGVRYGFAKAGELEELPHRFLADTPEEMQKFLLQTE